MSRTPSRILESKLQDSHYRCVDGFWDEAVLSSGFPRRHWRALSVAIGRMGFRQFSRSWQSGQQILQSQGVTYNVGSDPKGNDRPWPMDPVPMVLPAGEWAGIERAVSQRAMLLNAMLADLYGAQRLIKEKTLPPAMVYANPHFLRPCHGIRPAGGVFLHSYAVDLGRSPDGKWWVISDRTQSPSGMGYTLENRLLSARTLPNVFSKCRVRQLTRFFDARRNALLECAPMPRDTPSIVLLTPGPRNETYFEHSFLAGHWGFPLVEGADLTVRDNRVYLKTLSGLRQVDVILRRMDDAYCDPVELRGDSLLGIPGLVHAVRNGTVAIDNPLGSGLVETSAQMAFLPGLCRKLLDEDLLMPSVATWWCGQPEPLRYVMEHLDELVLKPAFRSFGSRPEFPAVMSERERDDLRKRIEARPEDFVAQEQVALSTVPVRTDEGIVPRHLVLRAFAAWDGQGYTVMPGGLTRVSTEEQSMIVSMQLGGGSKDTWVLGTDEEDAPPTQPRIAINMLPVLGNLPSRVADNLFWLGRYAERVESNARLFRAILPSLSGEHDFGGGVSLQIAVDLLAKLNYVPVETVSASIGEQHWQLQRFLGETLYDPSRSTSLGFNLRELRRVSWELKARLSADTWRVLQELESIFSRVAPSNAEQRYLAEMNLLDNAITTLSAFSGLLMENTTRGLGWRFLEIGRRMERALQAAELIKAGFTSSPEDAAHYMQLLLQVADSSITYRTRHLGFLRAELVLDLLLKDETNPRSVTFQMATLCHQMDRLQEKSDTDRQSNARFLAAQLLNMLRDSEPMKLAEPSADGGGFADLMGEIKTGLQEFSDALTAEYLAHLPDLRRISSF